MPPVVVGVAVIAGSLALGVTLAFLTHLAVDRAETRREQKTPPPQPSPPLPANRWRIRKKNGAWYVYRREWNYEYPYWDNTYPVIRHHDAYRFAAPTHQAALNYVERNHHPCTKKTSTLSSGG
jgi:hypothetical protein